jgi:hypothetical protein
MDAIKKNLGLIGCITQCSISLNKQLKLHPMAFTLNIENVGYASPYNERPFR